jgi:phosphatidylserine decarboxylase
VDLEEAAPQGGAYPTFDAFFTRRLKDGVRPIADAALVSPADGRIQSKGSISKDSLLYVKGQPYRVEDLIGDAEEAERYRGGAFAVVYLSPRDYHRVHAPVGGTIPGARAMPGDLFPVNPIGEQHVPQLLVKNQRVAIPIDTADIGRVQVVMVGATIVGKITVTAFGQEALEVGMHHLEKPVHVAPGDEIGIFHLGSTAVLLLEPGTPIGRALGQVRYGESLLGSE